MLCALHLMTTEYVVQKGMGVMVMHAILMDVMEIVRSSGRSVIESSTYRDIMKEPMERLQGEAQDGIGSPVQGVEFGGQPPLAPLALIAQAQVVASWSPRSASCSLSWRLCDGASRKIERCDVG